MNRETALDLAYRCSENDLQQRACRWVADRLEALPGKVREILPGQIAHDLGLKPESIPDVLKALDLLSLNSIGLLEMGFELNEASGVLDFGVPLTGEEIAEAMRTGQLISPRSGEPVPDYRERVSVVYRVRPEFA